MARRAKSNKTIKSLGVCFVVIVPNLVTLYGMARTNAPANLTFVGSKMVTLFPQSVPILLGKLAAKIRTPLSFWDKLNR
jgi:hypothetical protein